MTKNRVNEEKLLNDLFVLLEYSSSLKEFVEGLSEEQHVALHTALHQYPDE